MQGKQKFFARRVSKASRARQNTWHVGHVRHEAHGNILSRKRCKAVNSVQNFWHVGHVRQEGQANTFGTYGTYGMFFNRHHLRYGIKV